MFALGFLFCNNYQGAQYCFRIQQDMTNRSSGIFNQLKKEQLSKTTNSTAFFKVTGQGRPEAKNDGSGQPNELRIAETEMQNKLGYWHGTTTRTRGDCRVRENKPAPVTKKGTI